MSEDRYEITNPWAVKWHGSILHILEKEDDPSFRVLDSEAWDIEFIIKAHKLEPIKPGQVWISQIGNSKTVRHIYFDGTIQENVVVSFQQPDTWSALRESTFRKIYSKELPE